MWIQTGVRVRKRLSWVLTSVTLTFDLWPWPFSWTSLLTMVITPENFMMIRWWEHGEKGVTDGQTDRHTDRHTENTICRAAWSQLKTSHDHLIKFYGQPSLWSSTSEPSFSGALFPQLPPRRFGAFVFITSDYEPLLYANYHLKPRWQSWQPISALWLFVSHVFGFFRGKCRE